MTKKDKDRPTVGAEQAVDRRHFLKQGAFVGAGAAALGGPALTAEAQTAPPTGHKWDYETDVLVIGAGASGLPCAIRARDAGLNVLTIAGRESRRSASTNREARRIER